jgi:branched-chain amino acid transport system permease protein
MGKTKYGNWIAVLLLIVLPFALNDPFLTHLGIRAATYAIVVMGLTLFAGYTGQISLGHAAFFGMGAYLSGILTKQGISYPLAVLFATVIVGVVGLIVGLVVLRTEGHYLALASIAVAMIFQVVAKNIDITGGPTGLTAIPKPNLFGLELRDDLSYYYFVILFMFLSFIILRRMIDSRTGDALRSIANNELAAQSLGIPVFRYKVLSFTVSTLFTGFAGTLFGHYDGYVDPARLGMEVSVLFLIMAFIGGVGNLHGSIIGAFAITIIEDYTQDFGQYNILVYGILLVLIILFLPKGLVDLPKQLAELWKRFNSLRGLGEQPQQYADPRRRL